jgi:hypothetical protein
MSRHLTTARMGPGSSDANRGRKVSTAGSHQHHTRTIAKQRPRDWVRAVSAVAQSVWKATRRYWKRMARYRHAGVWDAATLVLECAALGVMLFG